MLNFLFERGAHGQNGWDGMDDQPIHLAAESGHVRAIALLLENGATIDSLTENTHTHDRRGRLTPLHFAALAGHTDVISFLVERGAKVETQIDEWDNPIDLAVVLGQKAAVHWAQHKKAKYN